jgi:predicted Zn-dependent peptidase
MLPRLFLAMRSPVFGSEGYYAASVAGAILGMRKGSRLHRSLVRERQIAAEANAFTFDLTKGTDLLVIDVTARPETAAEELEEAVARELDVMMQNGVSADEVERAVALIETDLISALQSAGERADQLSKYATYFGDPALINEQADRYRAVTAEQVSRFARERMRDDNRASLLYVPKARVAAEMAAVAAEAETA